MNNGFARIGLVLTGGTIASSERDGMLVVDLTDAGGGDEAQLVVRGWSGPETLDLRTRTPVRKLSESMTTHDWLLVANAVRNLVEEEGIRQVCVIHGTDTAGFTSAALSYLLSDLDATTVVTGANFPSSDRNSDAQTNVSGALAAMRALPRGVYFSFAGTPGAPSDVHLGTHVRKVKAEGQAYLSPNGGPVARVIDGSLQYLRKWRPISAARRDNAISSDVAYITVYPGVDLEMMSDALISTGKLGVVVRLYPAATASENFGPDSLLRFVRRCRNEGLIVVACVEQMAESSTVYPSLVSIKQAGAIFAGEMIPETAYVKLAWALGQAADRADAERLFRNPLCESAEGDAFQDDEAVEV